MRKILVLLLIGIATLTCSFDLAAAMSHEHHSHDVVSPFEGKPTLPNHCELQGHSLKNPCPHLLNGSRNKKSLKDVISVDCSGSQKHSGFSGAKKHEVCSSNKNLSGASIRFALHSSYDLILHFIHPPLYHPPRFI